VHHVAVLRVLHVGMRRHPAVAMRQVTVRTHQAWPIHPSARPIRNHRVCTGWNERHRVGRREHGGRRRAHVVPLPLLRGLRLLLLLDPLLHHHGLPLGLRQLLVHTALAPRIHRQLDTHLRRVRLAAEGAQVA
jgi:hypothetical protein